MSAHTPAIDLSRDRLRIEPTVIPVAQRLQLFGLGLLGVSAVIGLFAGDGFFRAYALNYCLVLSIALGALFFVLIQHLTRAGWSVVVRRLAELITSAFPLLALLSLPLVIPMALGWPASIHTVYPWTDPAYVAAESLLQHKAPYLNTGFFLVRVAAYFIIWIGLSSWLMGRSLEQDRTGDPELSRSMGRWSAPGMFLFGLSLTFFAFDFLMSMAPTWYSTIFGVYYFAGAFMAFNATLVIVMVLMQASGRLEHAISTEHYHDVGKLMFAFIVFWAYIGFSQYMLIWYANMPETTSWFVMRQKMPWLAWGLVLLFGQFLLPFLLVISRNVKRHKTLLLIAAIWVLAMRWVDLGYLTLPPYFFLWEKGKVALFNPLSVVLAVTLLISLVALTAGWVLQRMTTCTLIPERDPRLGESLAFENI